MEWLRAQVYKIGRLLDESPGFVIAAVLCLILGMLLGGSHAKVPELTNALIGPAIGAFLAVAAGAWLATSQSRRAANEAKQFLLPELRKLSNAILAALNTYAPYEKQLYLRERLDGDKNKSLTGMVEAATAIARLDDELKIIRRRMIELRGAFALLGLSGNIAYSDILSITSLLGKEINNHYYNQGDIVAEYAERFVEKLLDFWQRANGLVIAAEKGVQTDRSDDLPDILRDDKRWSPG